MCHVCNNLKLTWAAQAVDEAGQLSEKTRPFLQAFIDAYSQWVETVKGV